MTSRMDGYSRRSAHPITAFGFGMITFDAFSFTQATFLWFIMLGLGAAALRLAGEPAQGARVSLRSRFAAVR